MPRDALPFDRLPLLRHRSATNQEVLSSLSVLLESRSRHGLEREHRSNLHDEEDLRILQCTGDQVLSRFNCFYHFSGHVHVRRSHPYTSEAVCLRMAAHVLLEHSCPRPPPRTPDHERHALEDVAIGVLPRRPASVRYVLLSDVRLGVRLATDE